MACSEQIFIKFAGVQTDIRTMLSIKTKRSVTLLIQMNKCQSCHFAGTHQQVGCINSGIIKRRLQKLSKPVFSDFPDKSSFGSQFGQHGKNVGRSSARVRRKKRHPIFICTSGQKNLLTTLQPQQHQT